MGGILHLRLNTGGRPIANKYREGKMKSTLKRESKELEVVEREAIVTSDGSCVFGTGANSFTSRLRRAAQPRIYPRRRQRAVTPVPDHVTSWHQLSWYDTLLGARAVSPPMETWEGDAAVASGLRGHGRGD